MRRGPLVPEVKPTCPRMDCNWGEREYVSHGIEVNAGFPVPASTGMFASPAIVDTRRQGVHAPSHPGQQFSTQSKL